MLELSKQVTPLISEGLSKGRPSAFSPVYIMYLIARAVSQQNFDSKKTWEQLILKWIEIAMKVINGFFVTFFKDYVYAFHWFSRGLINAKDFPLAIFIGPWIVLIPLILVLAPLILIQEAVVLVLTALGFDVSGVTCSSPAALFHSFCYDEDTSAGSTFAYLQSAGATYQVDTVRNPVLLVIRALAGVVAVYIIVSMIH
ncbi:uncharacterized protein EV420DRAFT_146200 [Desarmillaria tabescens]|uniref:Uncharacterized protein n=1 Tax=Armillaria tabescens TaxID=1929756 RepID=A0AA39TX55_ARMTA|nr:uncharacterized protein EV420DRAFT_146200 [Desarmillaria tabescens]KAK0462075.1 hypothetical protein EV420DRAFT_146200 [Desarmillaria tabescens]